MRKLRPWIFGLLLTFLFTEIWLGFPIRLEHNEPELPQNSSDQKSEDSQPVMKGKKVHLVESSRGDRDWELEAEMAQGYEGIGKWQLTTVKVLFYSENKVQFTVTGNSAELDTNTKDMKIEGNVKTVSENGYRFESPMLLYTNKQRLLQSPGPVKMFGPKDTQGEGLILTANYMRGLVDQSEIQLDGKVNAQRKFRTGHVIRIKSERAKFSGKHYHAQFQNQVMIEYDSMKLESPEAAFQYQATSNLLESIQMKGGVKISDQDKYATSDLVKIEPETNRIVLTGKPRVVQDQDELTGEQIVFVDGGKKVKIEKMRARVEKAPGE